MPSSAARSFIFGHKGFLRAARCSAHGHGGVVAEATTMDFSISRMDMSPLPEIDQEPPMELARQTP
jgi:hypothetical protein